jgi:methionyl-tRNA formyltransferase
MRLVFAGTPELARVVLDALLASSHKVVGVLTQPDRPVGRHRGEAVPPPVKVRALRAGLPVLQPTRLSVAAGGEEAGRDPAAVAEGEEAGRDPAAVADGEDVAAWLTRLGPDAVAVAAYGRIIPADLLSLPPRGWVNVHASLLPRWRGAAPIQHAILAGDAETGVCIMRMDEGMDTGPVWACEATPIDEEESAGELSARLAELGGRLLVRTLSEIEAAREPRPQDDVFATMAPKLAAEDLAIDWSLPADELDRRVRAADPKPGAAAKTSAGPLKVWRARPVAESREDGPAAQVGIDGTARSPGTIVATSPDLIVACAMGALALEEVQPAGGPRMSGAAWARGRRLAPRDPVAG